ncbi:MAG: hypothetical protein JNJ77_18980 [Planctomycetia bacterium]|nr:hypothetical protein [Planctomycetia bacterium]
MGKRVELVAPLASTQTVAPGAFRSGWAMISRCSSAKSPRGESGHSRSRMVSQASSSSG